MSVQGKTDREILTEDIISREWQMFTRVSNEGGRASCQDDRKTFEIMRTSQFAIWDLETLESYREDLLEAQAAGRNLMTEKYGYMMADTAPEAFEQIRGELPEVSEEKRRLVKTLTGIQLGWMAEFRERFPEYGKQGRPLYKKDAVFGETSLETYAVGELLTCSVKTLLKMNACFRKMEENKINGGLCIMK